MDVTAGWLVFGARCWFCLSEEWTESDYSVCSCNFLDQIFNFGDVDFVQLFSIVEVGDLMLEVLYEIDTLL